MKTVTRSNRFYYHELDEKDASAIKNDLVLYNKMLHKAYEQVADSLYDTEWTRYSLGHSLNYDKK